MTSGGHRRGAGRMRPNRPVSERIGSALTCQWSRRRTAAGRRGDAAARGGRRVAAAMVLTALVAGGCADQSPNVTFSTTPQIPQQTESSSTRSLGERAVEAAYLAFLDTSERATRMRPEQLRQALQKYSVGSYVDFQIREILSARSKGQEPWGKIVRHIGRIEVNGDDATVHDCQDASGAGLADSRTGELIAGTRGPKQRNIIVYLVRGRDGQWRVNSLKQFKEQCTYSETPSSSP